jgi:hypothetical protein
VPDLSGSELLAQKERNLIMIYTLDISTPRERNSESTVIQLFSKSPLLINLSRLRHLRLTVEDDLSLIGCWITLVAAPLVQLDLTLKRKMSLNALLV